MPPASGRLSADFGVRGPPLMSHVRPRGPTISVLLDGELLARVNTTGYDVVSVGVHGTRIDEEFATLDMSGGAYPENRESTYLIWINRQTLRPRQQIEVRLEENGETLRAGKTIEELFPAARDAEEQGHFYRTDALFAELRAMPLRRGGFSFQVGNSTGASYAGRTAPADHGFGFSLLWNSYRPERARCALHAYTLEELQNRRPMRDLIREYVEAPCAVTLRVDA